MMFFGCNLLSVNPLKCFSMSNQEFIVRPEIVMLIVINTVVVVIILMIHMQNCLSLMLLKTLISKFLI